MSEDRLRTWTIGIAFLLVGTLGAFLLGQVVANLLLVPARLTRAHVRRAPGLVGVELEQARERARGVEAGLDVLGIAHGADVDSGEVLFQFPPEGMPLEPGKPVEVIVSAGAGVKRVPDLAGFTRASAVRVLRTAGISVGGSLAVSGEGFEKGTVVRSSPPAGTPVAEGDSVVLLVSRGESVVEVPNLIGETAEEAAKLLHAVQLEVGETTFGGSGAGGAASAEPVVVGQDPAAGALAPAGAPVDLRLDQAPGSGGETE